MFESPFSAFVEFSISAENVGLAGMMGDRQQTLLRIRNDAKQRAKQCKANEHFNQIQFDGRKHKELMRKCEDMRNNTTKRYVWQRSTQNGWCYLVVVVMVVVLVVVGEL